MAIHLIKNGYFCRYSAQNLLTGIARPGSLCAYATTERLRTVYISDFIQLDGERFYVAVDTRTAKIRLERINDDAIAQFMRNILMLGEDGTIPGGRFPKVSGVSA